MFGNFLSGKWRKASKCKKLLEHLQYHLKLLKNKKQAVSRILRNDIAQILIQLNDQTRALRLTKELFVVENTISVYDLLLQFSGFILLKFHSIRNQRFGKELLDDKINEAVSSLIFASARCGELHDELTRIRKIFAQHYGQLYVSTALELRRGNFVNLEIKEKLLLVTSSVSEEDVSVRLLLDEIAKQSGLEDMLRYESEKHVTYMDEERKSQEETSDCDRIVYNAFVWDNVDCNVLTVKIEEEEEEEEERRRLLPRNVHPKLRPNCC